MPATKEKKERKVKIQKDTNEEIVESVTRSKATFSYIFSHKDEEFSGLDIVVCYEETDNFDQMDNGTTKRVTSFEVDGSEIIPTVALLRCAVEDIIVSSVKGHMYIDDDEYNFIVYRIMHNIKHFIYSNSMKLEGDWK